MSKTLFDRGIGVGIGFCVGILFMVVLTEGVKEVTPERESTIVNSIAEPLRLTVKCPLCDESAVLNDYTADNRLTRVYTYVHRTDGEWHWSYYDKNYVLKQTTRYP